MQDTVRMIRELRSISKKKWINPRKKPKNASVENHAVCSKKNVAAVTKQPIKDKP